MDYEEADRAILRKLTHQHDVWMIRDDGDGGRYCAACGEGVPATYGIDSFDDYPTPTEETP